MPPTRIALIGLSASATGTGWAATAHLPYLARTPYFQITALLNSSVEAAQKAVQAYKLPPETKAYGSPEDLANDPDVDLVVCNVRVDSHAKTLLPSLRKGRDVFCEWPLDKNEKIAQEMLEAAKEGGGRCFVGLQGRLSPIVQTVKGLVDSGRIGKVLSSTVSGAVTNGGGVEGKGVRYFVDRSVGGNMYTIAFAHLTDTVLSVLGELTSFRSILANQRPETKIVDRAQNDKVIETVIKDTPDQIMLQGTLESGAVLSMHIRGGAPFPDRPNLLWRIYGSAGEIEVSAPRPFLNTTEEATILLHDQATGEVKEIPVEPDSFDKEYEGLPGPARNIGRVYEAYAKGSGTEGLVSFAEAVKRHAMLDEMYIRWDNGEQ